MKPRNKKDRGWLVETAQAVVEKLRTQGEGTRLRLRRPRKVYATDTDGWSIVIGSLGRGHPSLEIWLDRFTRQPNRKFYATFYSKKESAIRKLVFHSKALLPVRTLNDDDLAKSVFTKMKEKLQPREFNEPVLENYRDQGYHFLGFYYATIGSQRKEAKSFCDRAVDFFLDVANALPVSKADAARRPVDPQIEAKKWVKAHLGRERSRFLAHERKRRDHYKCKVCDMTFTAVYGKALGEDFAEAHHIKPLARAPKNIRTCLEDLVTVCSNCHRMLHRMDNDPDDVKRLREIVKKGRS